VPPVLDVIVEFRRKSNDVDWSNVKAGKYQGEILVNIILRYKGGYK